MRKNIHIAGALVILLSLAGISCKKSFLDVVPKGQLIAATYDDYNLLMNGSNFYVFYFGGAWQPAMLMGDEVGAQDTYYDNGSNPPGANSLFQWQDNVFLSTEQPLFLTTFLTNIYTCNKIIGEVTGVPGGTAAQELELQAEAMSQRAFTYFQLINYFAKPYTAATASADPGFPIITGTDITANDFTRNPVQDVYDFIVKDLKDAIPNLQLTPPVATRMSRPAAEGLLGKVYLFMGNDTAALAMFNAAFGDLAQMGTPPELYNYNVTFGPGGSFLPIDDFAGPTSPFNNVTDLTESVVAVMSYCGPDNGNGYGNDFLLITPQTAALYGPSDRRLQFYTNLEQDGVTPIPGGMLRKYGVSYARIGLELPDLYLLRAECEARLNDLAAAKADVEALRVNRMPPANAVVPADTAANQTELIEFIINERSREFASTGYRWWDMRRLSADPLFSGRPAAVHTVYAATGPATQYTLSPDRLTLRIPQYYLSANPGMTDNP
jgi:hypothetical protein